MNILADVIELWKQHAKTLGFFPEGAFIEHASKGNILIALDNENTLLGYLLFRISKQRVNITHLCIGLSCQGSGLSRGLLECLKKETEGLKGIGLYCRRDYGVNTFWPKLGFIPVNEKSGRGKDMQPLTFWWLDYNSPNLFTQLIDNNEKIEVIVDANVFFDLDENNNKSECIEAKALAADWFTAEVKISITNEIYTEVNRHSCKNERQRQRKRTHEFSIVDTDLSKVEEIERDLSVMLRVPRNEQDRSDYRQLAHAVASNANYFVSRDDYILKHQEVIYENYGLNIRRPAEIILEIDSLHDEASYRPARLAGTLASLSLVSGEDIKLIAEKFCLSSMGERKRSLEKKLAQIIAQPDKNRVFIAKDDAGEMIASFSIAIDGETIRVEFGRVVMSRLSSTLARYLLIKFIRDFQTAEVGTVEFSDTYIQTVFLDAFKEQGFLKDGNKYCRLVIKHPLELLSLERIVQKKSEGSLAIAGGEFSSQFTEVITGLRSKQDRYSLVALEKLIWPAKVVGFDIPCYIVPIRAGWARGLFDEALAGQDLFGAKLDLAVQNESVYYYSDRGVLTTAPARVLWYVSQDKKIQGSGAIRACSMLNEVAIDTPKSLFKKYRRLGVYEWKDVFKTARNDIDNKLIAMNFSQTELFTNPISWHDVQGIINGLPVNKTIVSATPIPIDTFMELYAIGTAQSAKIIE